MSAIEREALRLAWSALERLGRHVVRHEELQGDLRRVGEDDLDAIGRALTAADQLAAIDEGPLDPSVLNERIIDNFAKFRTRAQGLVGRRARIVKFYNGQDCGTSRKNIQGQVRKIVRADVALPMGLIILVEGYEYGHPYLTIDQWELEEET